MVPVSVCRNLGDPGPKPRPALVRNTGVVDDEFGEVEVVFGTTNLANFKRIDDFYITKNSAMDACGLYRATRFDLSRCHWLPWASEWFVPLFGSASPVIGTLDLGSVKSLQTTIAYTERRAQTRDRTD